MTQPSPIPQVVAKLLPRLASVHDGEIVATARAIERTLRSAGLDLHSLASALGPRLQAPKAASFDDTSIPSSWERLVRWVEANARGRLDERERRLLARATMIVRHGEPNSTEKIQLVALYSKLREADCYERR